jgi:CubicO group peptidase (beta-lactamase class C family)
MVALLLGMAACSPFEPDHEEVADPEEEIRRIVGDNEIASVAAVVVRDDEIVWEVYVGDADVDEQLPAGPATAYGLASVSKLVVATAVMQQVEQGRLDLSADLNEYLDFPVRNPGFPDDPVTAYHLLTHTAGLIWPFVDADLPGFYRAYPDQSVPPLGEWLPEFLLPGGVSNRPSAWLVHPPGEFESYSNLGISLLAHVVEAVTGQAFDSYCTEHIFTPLGMSNTAFAYADLAEADIATLYSVTGRPWPRGVRLRAYPSGGLTSTAPDFARFLSMYLNEGAFQNTRILSEQSVEDILTIQNPASGQGLIWQAVIGGWFGHEGGAEEGIASYAEIHPDRGLGIFIVSNQRNPLVYPGGVIHGIVRDVARGFTD